MRGAVQAPGLAERDGALSLGAEYPALLAEAIREANAVGNLVFDAQVVAVCREGGVSELVTEDRDFNRFKGLNVVGIHYP